MNIAKLDRWSLDLLEFDISLEFIKDKLYKIADVISRLKNKELYTKHLNEKPVNEQVNLQDRIEEILDIATNPSNFEKVFNAGQVLSTRKLLQGQKRDKLCKGLAKMLHKDNNLRINHKGLLVKQIGILRNTYRVYVIPQRLVHCIIKIFHDKTGHQGISRTINMIKKDILFQKNERTSLPTCEQLFNMLSAYHSQN